MIMDKEFVLASAGNVISFGLVVCVLGIVLNMQYQLGFNTSAIESIQQSIIDIKNHFNVTPVEMGA